MVPGNSQTSATDGAQITDVKAMALRDSANQTLVKIETDSGVGGYGEAGTDGDTVRAQLAHIEEILLGADPLEVEKLYDRMITMQHPYRPHVPTVSGVDIALWDLAGKLLDRSVSKLLTGRFREKVPLYGVYFSPDDYLDPDVCREWGEYVRSQPEGYPAVKLSFDNVIEQASPDRGSIRGRDTRTVTSAELRKVERAARNLRDGLGDDVDLIVHCHNEWDLPSATGLAKAAAPADPLWIEDPLRVEYSDNWQTLHENSPVNVLTGEKLELLSEFRPFLENGAVDALQPDLAFAGGITGCRRLAELADSFSVPLTAHNCGTLVHNAATLHFAASVRNFWMTESRYPHNELYQTMGTELVIEDGKFQVPDGPGLGITLDEDVIKEARKDGEPYWG